MRFFDGPVYPAVVCVLALVGYVTNLEVYFNIAIMLMLATGILLTNSIRPLITPLLVLLFQVTPKHSPAVNTNHELGSNYYFRLENLIPTGVAFSIAIAAIVIFFVRLCKNVKIKIAGLPFFVPSVILALAFALGGAFSREYIIDNLGFAAVEILGFFLIFYLFYVGFVGESPKGILKYFVYVNAFIAILLVLETVWVYYTGEVVNPMLEEQAQSLKGQVYYGWGLSTTAGQAMTITLPLLFYGAMKSRAWPFYITVAVLTLSSVIFTLSRGAILISVLAVIVSVLIGCFAGGNKKPFKMLLPAGLIVLVVLAVISFDTIETVFSTLFEIGISDSGRFNLWGQGFDAFLRAPIFGEGFWSFYTTITYLRFDVFPPMLHNTLMEILGAMGLFGIVAYTVYRVATVRTFFRAPSLGKTMLGIAILTLLLQSLFDNFIFYVQPMFYYSVALAIAVKLTEQSEREYSGLNVYEGSAVRKEAFVAKVVGTELKAHPVYRKESANIKVIPKRIKPGEIKKKRK